MNEAEAIRSRIIGGAGMAAMIDVDASNLPAVFSRKKPADYNWGPKPAVIIRRPTDLSDISAFAGRMSNLAISVVCYALLPVNSTDDSAVHTLALAIRELFRGKSFVGADGILYQALVSGPIAAPTDDENMVGELLLLRVNVGD